MLKISILQTTIVWEEKEANLKHFEKRIAEAPDSDLILLPEAFTSGFSMNPETIADDGSIVGWLKEQAVIKQAAICGSVMTRDQGRCVNRLYFMKPDGDYAIYDKRHLFTMGSEPEHYEPGKERIIVEYKGWRILPLICYDLRFPVFSRNDVDYHLLLYVANWPAKRSMHWRSLLMARAIENQCYVAACNRIGSDGYEVDYQGDSILLDYKGDTLSYQDDREQILYAELSEEDLKEGREKFPVLKDRDTFSADWK